MGYRPTAGLNPAARQLTSFEETCFFRLLELRDGKVVFRYKDYAADSRQKTMTLDALEFLRRFLQHVLPKSFVKIRPYGLLANAQRTERLTRCRQLLLALGVLPALDRSLVTARFDSLHQPVRPMNTKKKMTRHLDLG